MGQKLFPPVISERETISGYNDEINITLQEMLIKYNKTNFYLFNNKYHLDVSVNSHEPFFLRSKAPVANVLN